MWYVAVVDSVTNAASGMAQVKAMGLITAKLETAFRSPNLFVREQNTVKAVFKKRKIAQRQALLGRSKSTLMLARQTVLE